MNKNLNDKLLEDFPRLFQEMGIAEQDSCMAWGCTCGDGWFPIIHDLARKVEEEFQKYPEERKTQLIEERKHIFVQVKQKFCLLRAYMDRSIYGENGSEKIRQLVAETEKLSADICECCGGPRIGKYAGFQVGRANCQKCEEDKCGFTSVH